MQLLQVLCALVLACVCHAFTYNDFLADLQYLYMKQQYPDDMSLSQLYPDEPYSSDIINDKISPDWQNIAYPDTVEDPAPKEPRDYGEAALRDQEYMKQLPLSGYQFISGGTGRQEDPSEVKTDKVLPAYCTPPNPCPHGYTGPDTCVKDFENSPDNNRRLLEEQDCACDAEHMLSCPPGKKTIDPKSGFVSDGIDTDVGDLDSLDSLDNIDLTNNAYLSSNRKRQKFIVKKSYDTQDVNSDDKITELLDLPIMNQEIGDFNPYIYGKNAKSVVKKMAPRKNK